MYRYPEFQIVTKFEVKLETTLAGSLFIMSTKTVHTTLPE